MDLSMTADVESGPLLLEELTEPLEEVFGGAPLVPGMLVTGANEASFAISSVLQSQSRFNLYEAASNLDGRLVWIREACGVDDGSRLQREAEILSTLECPMFPQVLECFGHEDRTYFVTSPFTGETLEEALDRRELQIPQLVSILSQVTFALTRLHAHGLVHMGLRPGIIRLGKPAQIVDLSYATQVGEKASGAFYHAGYSPPEIIHADPVDARSDIYAIGALLFHGVTGKSIDEAGAELSTYEHNIRVGGVPQILHRCLGTIESRYGTAEELHRDLLRLGRRCSTRLSHTTGAATSIGLEPSRSTNQDAYTCLSRRVASEDGEQCLTIACIADGMGGMMAGEVASDAAVKGVVEEGSKRMGQSHVPSAAEQAQWVKEWTETANSRVCQTLELEDARGGCTLLCACVIGDRLAVAHVGDCRLYLIRGDNIRQLTRDHSLAMSLVVRGDISEEEIRTHPDRSQVTRSLGDREPLPPHAIDTLEPTIGSLTMQLEPGDTLLLCSDGLWEPVLEADMLNVIKSRVQSLDAIAHSLLENALERGGPDNATAVLFHLDTPQE